MLHHLELKILMLKVHQVDIQFAPMEKLIHQLLEMPVVMLEQCMVQHYKIPMLVDLNILLDKKQPVVMLEELNREM